LMFAFSPVQGGKGFSLIPGRQGRVAHNGSFLLRVIIAQTARWRRVLNP
jgi:hypothetical protein